MANVRQLIETLIGATASRRLEWTETGIPDEFEVELGPEAVARVGRAADRMAFRVMRHDGRVVEEVEEERPVMDPETETWQFGRPEDWAPLDDLFTKARRSAMDADDVITSAIKFVSEKR